MEANPTPRTPADRLADIERAVAILLEGWSETNHALGGLGKGVNATMLALIARVAVLEAQLAELQRAGGMRTH